MASSSRHKERRQWRSSRSRLRAPCKPRSLRSELAASTHKHCTAASRWSIEGSPTSVV